MITSRANGKKISNGCGQNTPALLMPEKKVLGLVLYLLLRSLADKFLDDEQSHQSQV